MSLDDRLFLESIELQEMVEKDNLYKLKEKIIDFGNLLKISHKIDDRIQDLIDDTITPICTNIIPGFEAVYAKKFTEAAYFLLGVYHTTHENL